MGLLSRLLGQAFDRIVERAEKLEREGEPGDALLEYERALASDREGVSQERIREIESRAVELRDRIAGEHLRAGDVSRDEGDIEAAAEEYRTALQVAGSGDVEKKVQAKLDELDAGIARELATDSREPTQDEIFLALSGSWDEDQYDEYTSLGDAFRDAFLAYHSGRPLDAVAAYEKLLSDAGEDALFLLYELGRAHAAGATQLVESKAGNEEIEAHRTEAVDALERFLRLLPGGMTPSIRAAAWNELAQIHLERASPEDAEDALMNAQEAVPEVPLAYLNLGRFLMQQDRPLEAVDALEQGVEIMDKLRPDFRLLSDLGLAYRAAGREDEAVSMLESVVEGMVTTQQGFHDPYVTIPLADLYEKRGRLREASDLYRHLANGPDPAGHLLYNFEAARLLAAQDENELARSYLARARELVSGDTSLVAAIDDLAQKL